METVIMFIWLVSLPALYLIIWFGVKNGIKDAVKQLEIRLEQRDGETVLSAKQRERHLEPDDGEVLI